MQIHCWDGFSSQLAKWLDGLETFQALDGMLTQK